mgnify:CR=1 FL=1
MLPPVFYFVVLSCVVLVDDVAGCVVLPPVVSVVSVVPVVSVVVVVVAGSVVGGT